MDLSKKKLMYKLPLMLQASLCCLLWATAIPTLKISYSLLNIEASDVFNKLVLAGLRFTLAGVLIGLFTLLKDKKVTFANGQQWVTILIFGLLNTTLQYLFFYNGVGNTGAIKGALIDTSKPLIVVIFAHFLTKDDKITRNKIIGLCLGFVGIIIANLESIQEGGFDLNVSLAGEGALIMASVATALAVMYSRKAMKTIPSLMLNMHQMFVGALILLIIGLIGAKGYHLDFTLPAILLLIYSSILSAVAFVLWFKLIHQYGASSVTIYLFLIPVFGSFISSTIFPNESITWNLFISLILMCVSIYLVNKEKKNVNVK